MKLKEMVLTKSFWGGFALIVTGIVAIGTTGNVVSGSQSIVAGLTAIFLRQGMANEREKTVAQVVAINNQG